MTDPVELWSPINSKTRLNKNFYDSHFRPFYRTTQLIIRPTNSTPVHHSTTSIVDQVFSSAFDLDFLRQVLELQNKLTSITAEISENGTSRTISIEDICFAPLKPDNTKCTIMSVLNYYQNNLTNLNKVIYDEFGLIIQDYLDHLTLCTSSPTSVNDSLGLSCLGEFGGTIMPFGKF